MSKRIKELEKLIKKHQKLYYDLGKPEISDAEFDQLIDELQELDPDNKIVNRIGPDNEKKSKKIQHIIPMGSLSKVRDEKEFLDWIKKQKNRGFWMWSWKLDGISVEFQYMNGIFQKAVTRGNGKRGDDITKQMSKYAKNLKESSFTGGIRGEIVMSKKIFEEKYQTYTNPRNTVTSLAKTTGNDLIVLFYDVFHKNPKERFQKEREKFEFLIRNGLPTVEHELFDDEFDILKIYKEYSLNRRELDTDIDGFVIKPDVVDWDDVIENNRPKKQIALKFPPVANTTILNGIYWSVSGTTYFPVAELQPVWIDGSTISKASLVNIDMMKKLHPELRLGAEVEVVKRGDIIPKIEKVIKNGNGPFFMDLIPIKCFNCQTPLKLTDKKIFCPNKKCSNILQRQIQSWIKAFDIKQFGEELIKVIYENKMIKDLSDLYKLKKTDFIGKYQNVKNAETALRNLHESKNNNNISTIIEGLGIEGIGSNTAEKILTENKIHNFDQLENFIQMNKKSSSKKLQIFCQGLKENWKTLKNIYRFLFQKNITFPNSLKKQGPTFCFTGTLESMGRKEAENMVKKKLNGSITNSVTKKTDYLVQASSDSNSKKTKEAEKNQHTKIISEKEFLSLFS